MIFFDTLLFSVKVVAEAGLGFSRGRLSMRGWSLRLCARSSSSLLLLGTITIILDHLVVILSSGSCSMLVLYLKVLALLTFATELKFELLRLLLNFANYYASARSCRFSARLTIGSIEDTHFLDWSVMASNLLWVRQLTCTVDLFLLQIAIVEACWISVEPGLLLL